MSKFSKVFWTSNVVELLERAAYYGVFIVITLYLSNVLGFSDVQAGFISGIFSAGLYLLPLFSGAYADKIGFRKSLLIAFSLLTVGYLALGILPSCLESAGLVSYGDKTEFSGIIESPARWAIVPIMLLIMIGGSFIKSVISGTVARETTTENRAKGYSIFYMMVNIGAFSGKTIVEPLRQSLGDMGLVVLNYFSASATLLALIFIFLLYKSNSESDSGKSLKDVWSGLVKVLSNKRLMTLIFIIAGFWLVQGQMYATMPKYVLRMAGENAQPA
jgi:dipeptide/tripeptide permease